MEWLSLGLTKIETQFLNFPKSLLLVEEKPQAQLCMMLASQWWLGDGGVRRKKVEGGEGRRRRREAKRGRGREK